MRRLFVAIVLCGAVGCGSSSATTPDLGGAPDDSGLPGDGDGGLNDDGGASADLAGETCIASGPAQVSAVTRAAMEAPLASWNGTTTMSIWSVIPGPALQKQAWAEVQGGAVIASGDLPETVQNNLLQLFAFKSKHYFSTGQKLYGYGAGSWSSVVTGATMIVPGTTQLLALTGTSGALDAALYDGTTVGASQKISSNTLLTALSDGAGGFGVVTQDGSHNLYFVAYDGANWSSESAIGTANLPTVSPNYFLAHSGALWCLTYGALGGNTTAWVLSGGSWSSATLNAGNAGALVGNNGLFASNAGQGTIYVYNGGTWSSSTLGSVAINDSTQLAPLGNGFVFVDTAIGGSTTATIYGGSSWGTASTIVSAYDGEWSAYFGSDTSKLMLVTPTHVMTYESGAWTQPFKFGTGTAVNASAVPVLEGGDLAVVYPEPGVMNARARSAGTWAAPVAMPVAKTGGGLGFNGTTFARAASGHVLALWQQYDAGHANWYASEYDGCAWRTPVALASVTTGSPVAVAANASSFVIGYLAGGQVTAVPWNGSGVGAATTLGGPTTLPLLGSDGSSFVAAWTDTSGNVKSATSSDGKTWGAAVQVEAGPGWSTPTLVSGPAGVLEYASKSGQAANISARVWHAAAWSAPATLAASSAGSGWQCGAAVGNSDALIACNSPSSFDAQRFAGGAWSDVPIGSSVVSAVPAVGSDGTDYRVEFYGGTSFQSVVLHAGAWSSPVDDGKVTPIYNFVGVSGRAGTWTLLAGDTPGGSLYTLHATGAAAYDPATKQVLAQSYQYLEQGIAHAAGATDVYWLDVNTPALPGIAALFVDLAP